LAIFHQLATLIAREHKHRPIAGDILLIGRQTVFLTEDQALSLLRREGIEPRADYLKEVNESSGYISDRCFFSMMSAGRLLALDVDDFEGAEIIHDLNDELPEKYHRIADFIFNGSCTDDLFDPAMATQSMSKMLRPGGRVIDIEAGAPANGAIVIYSPEWFFDYYAVNNYADCQILCCTCADWPGMLRKPWKVHWWRPFYTINGDICLSHPNPPIGNFINVVIAEKGTNSTDDAKPIKAMYRLMYFTKGRPTYLERFGAYVYPEPDVYVERYNTYLASPRNFSLANGFREPPRRQRRTLKQVVHAAVNGLRAELGVRGFAIQRGGPLLFKFARIPSLPREGKTDQKPLLKGNHVPAPQVGWLPAN
jgi:hypothetical protein